MSSLHGEASSSSMDDATTPSPVSSDRIPFFDIDDDDVSSLTESRDSEELVHQQGSHSGARRSNVNTGTPTMVPHNAVNQRASLHGVLEPGISAELNQATDPFDELEASDAWKSSYIRIDDAPVETETNLGAVHKSRQTAPKFTDSSGQVRRQLSFRRNESREQPRSLSPERRPRNNSVNARFKDWLSRFPGREAMRRGRSRNPRRCTATKGPLPASPEYSAATTAVNEDAKGKWGPGVAACRVVGGFLSKAWQKMRGLGKKRGKKRGMKVDASSNGQDPDFEPEPTFFQLPQWKEIVEREGQPGVGNPRDRGEAVDSASINASMIAIAPDDRLER